MRLARADCLVDVPGGQVFVRRWHAGADAGPPIVLLHDSLGCVELWRDFPARLARAAARDVIAYDRLGFGRSAARRDPPSSDFIGAEARIHFPVIRRGLGLENFVLFGHSVGGAMALCIAAASGAECGGVITESAQSFVEARTLDGIRAAMQRFAEAEQFERLVRLHGARARWVLDAWTVWLSPSFRSWSLDAELGAIRCPVLAIHGSDDEFGSVAFPRRIDAGVAGPAQLAILEPCGHVPHRDRPDDVLRLVAAFLQRTPSPGGAAPGARRRPV
jgi:pimeloyl-ACP methyl ester carboxylesterase